MIDAVFVKKYFWSIFFLCCGIFLFIVCVLCLINGVTDVIPGIFFAIIYVIGSLFSLLFNHKAHISIKDGCIEGRYHVFGKINCKLSYVAFASSQFNCLIIQLKNGKVYRIFGISNSWWLCSVIMRNIDYELTKSPKELIEELDICKADRKRDIVYVCIGSALMFVNIFVTLILTNWKDLSEFNKNEWVIFNIFCIIEIITVLITFYIADKAGKKNLSVERAYYNAKRKTVESSPLPPGNVIMVLTNDNYNHRFTVLGYPNNDSVYYTVEGFNTDYSLINENKSEIFDDIESLPEDFELLIDISEKFNV